MYRVMLVEDDARLAQLVVEYLQNYEFAVPFLCSPFSNAPIMKPLFTGVRHEVLNPSQAPQLP
jgi:hypothetical protein